MNGSAQIPLDMAQAVLHEADFQARTVRTSDITVRDVSGTLNIALIGL
jgi:hypothetical protein